MVVTLLVEAGAVLARDLLAQDLVDEIRLAIAPFFVGDENAPRFALPAHYPHGKRKPDGAGQRAPPWRPRGAAVPAEFPAG